MRQLEPRIVRNHGSSSVGLAAEQCTVIKTCVILWHYYRYTEFILANNDVNLILHPFEETLPPGLRGNEGNIVGKRITCCKKLSTFCIMHVLLLTKTLSYYAQLAFAVVCLTTI